MLLSLRIKNLAIVEEAGIEFSPGFNVITGETGAGKSIIIGALGLLLGGRADRSLIRTGADSCVVEAEFDIKNIQSRISEFLDAYGLEKYNDRILIIKRVFSASGTTRQFINGSPTTLAILGELGNYLVDIHGPHDHQSLLKPACQLELLDSFAGASALVAEYSELVRQYNAIDNEIKSLVIDEQTYMRQVDMLRYQVNEITSANLKEDEDVELEQEYNRIKNAETLARICASILDTLSDSEENVVTGLSAVGRMLNEMQKYDPQAAEFLKDQHALMEQVQELSSKIRRYSDSIDLDESRLAEIESRLDLINSLKRKYGPRLSDVVVFGKEAQEKLNKLMTRAEELERLSSEKEKIMKRIFETAQALSKKRQKSAPELEKKVMANLNELGFRQSVFKVQFDYKEPDAESGIPATGFDKIEFMFSPNPGEALRPLRQIASSGELARVMLAIKTVLAEHDKVPVLVFDEVDANIGGETAVAVGEKMREIGRQHQVLCITHLASVAAAAVSHFLVKKEVRDGRTYAAIEPLSSENRVFELARMLGGQSQTAIQHARALLKKQK